MRKFSLLITVLLLSVSTLTIFGQESKEKTPWVYESEFQIPWSRVDSLWKLVTIVDGYGYVSKAVEMGFLLDARVYIHHTGGIWNVKYQWIYPTWEALNERWDGDKVWEAVGVDEKRVKEINGGFNWVFTDVIHQDNIYRLLMSKD